MRNLKKKFIIAIDGPVGAGKSTIAKLVAEKLSYKYIDTGAMYRALAYKALKEGVDPRDKKSLAKLAKETKILLKKEKGDLKVYLEGKEVGSRQLRSEEIGKKASLISKVKGVRKELVRRQREMGASGGVVAEGRDIGTVVFPRADFKFYLEATSQERAKRRYQELKERSCPVNFREIKKEIEKRDRNDRSRKISPLRKAKDAILIDSTNMSVEEELKEILKVIEEECFTG
jgi:cytidylate kinase